MKHLLKLLIILNLSWSIGFQSLLIPPNSEQLSTSSTGIADNLDPFLNPAIGISKSYLQYSINTWLGEQKGNQGLIKWGKKIPQQFSIQTWNAEKIELRGEYPSNSPLGTFSTHFISTSYSISHHFNTNYQYTDEIYLNFGSRNTNHSIYGDFLTGNFNIGKKIDDKNLFYTFCKCNTRLFPLLETNNNQFFNCYCINHIIIDTGFNFFLSTSSLIFSMA